MDDDEEDRCYNDFTRFEPFFDYNMTTFSMSNS
ncbi:unnamed protein product, partial [Rotaria sp. Silwood2]